MNTKTMEGLIGANSNTNLINTPMRIYKDARHRGDTATMERAMGYVAEFEDKAQEYKVKADEGLKEETRDNREKAELRREQAIYKRKEEQKELEEKIVESKDNDADTDTVEISEEGKVLTHADSGEVKIDASNKPLTYTKLGEVILMEQKTGVSISV